MCLVVGFSKPGEPVLASAVQQAVLPGLGESPTEETSAADNRLAESVRAHKVGTPTRQTEILLPAIRPFSFAEPAMLEPTLGGVSSRQWLAASTYSSDRVRESLNGSNPLTFLNVGFPDIRTHKRPKRIYNDGPVDPSRWTPMVAWRSLGDELNTVEPIPHLRCMGLSPEAVARRADRYESLIQKLAVKYDISASLIKAVVTEESCFNKNALSQVGAQGLMQLMPDTANWLKVKDPHDPEDNLRAGVRYLAYLRDQFDSLETVLAAYNAGPGNVRRYNGVPPFAETQAYVQKVQANYRRYSVVSSLEQR